MESHAPALDTALAADVVAALREFPDFPEPGVLFQDLSPVFADPVLLRRIARAVVTRFDGGFDVVLAIEARGFPLGALVAAESERPLVLARKPGKLPGPVHRVRYALEYGRTTLEIQRDALAAGARVLLVDDVLATGGTLVAAAELVHLAGAEATGCAVVVAIRGLGGAGKLPGIGHFRVATVPVPGVD
ncbi:adenine phosphoribosyltransferase [Amycolatopsis sp. 195334CR]|nr:adenine phosphoribosyltransferase [Amycolatopsis sp. 195334CR]